MEFEGDNTLQVISETTISRQSLAPVLTTKINSKKINTNRKEKKLNNNELPTWTNIILTTKYSHTHSLTNKMKKKHGSGTFYATQPENDQPK